MKKIFVLLALLASFTACSKTGDKLKIAATSTPQAVILASVKDDLKKEGVDLQIIQVDDYNIPNRSLAEGEVDANYFQHIPFLDAQIAQFHYCLTPIAKIHIEPLRIFSSKIHSLNDLPNGAKVAIPNDPTNEARALRLLEQLNLLVLDSTIQELATIRTVKENPKALQFIEVDAALLPRILDDVTIAAIPMNFALQAGLSPKDALAEETGSSPYANVLVVRCGDENREDLLKVKAALTSEKTRTFIIDHFHGAIVPAF